MFTEQQTSESAFPWHVLTDKNLEKNLNIANVLETRARF